MNFSEELAVAGALELTDSELEAAHGAWGYYPVEYVIIDGQLVPVQTYNPWPYYGGWGWNGGWGRWHHWGHRDWDRDGGWHGGHDGGDHDGGGHDHH